MTVYIDCLDINSNNFNNNRLVLLFRINTFSNYNSLLYLRNEYPQFNINKKYLNTTTAS